MKSLSHVRLFVTPWTISLPGSSIHGIFQARVLERVAISFSRGSSWPRDRTRVSHIVGRRFTLWATTNSFKKICQKPVSSQDIQTVQEPICLPSWWHCSRTSASSCSKMEWPHLRLADSSHTEFLSPSSESLYFSSGMESMFPGFCFSFFLDLLSPILAECVSDCFLKK